MAIIDIIIFVSRKRFVRSTKAAVINELIAPNTAHRIPTMAFSSYIFIIGFTAVKPKGVLIREKFWSKTHTIE